MKKLLLIIPFLFALPAFGAGGTCPSGANYVNATTNPLVTLSSLGITSCYFVSAGGADTNSGTTEAASFVHAPFMPNCANSCSTAQGTMSGTGAAGIGIIFKGGDTWHFGAATAPASGGKWEFNASPFPEGTNTHPIYLGVDPTWFTGGSWTRPIFNADNPLCNAGTAGTGGCNNGTTTCTITNCPGLYYVNSCAQQVGSSNTFIDVSAGDYFIFDNFEMTGLCQSHVGQPAGQDVYINYGSICNSGCSGSAYPLILSNLYIHGWSHLQFAGSNGNTNCTGSTVCINIYAFYGDNNNTSVGEALRYNIVDGADSDPIGGGLCFCGFYDVAYNYFSFTSQGIMRTLHLFHDNWYGNLYENGHTNLLESADVAGTNAIYNNVFPHIEQYLSSGGGVFLWPGPVASSTTDYIFNNVGYDVGGLEYFNVGGVGLTTNTGHYVLFNNTFQTNIAQVILRCGGQSAGTTVDTNNHYIDNQTPYQSCPALTTTTTLCQSNTAGGTSAACPTYSDANVTPKFDQYVSSGTYAYSPQVATNSTVGTGTNEIAGYCAALTSAGLSAAATACQSDTTYACTYAGNGAALVCPARIFTARPASTAWSIGTYELTGSNLPKGAPAAWFMTGLINDSKNANDVGNGILTLY